MAQNNSHIPNSNFDSEVSQWWSTAIIDMEPGHIAFRGIPIQKLMGNISFSEMIWWMIFGKKMMKHEKELFEVAMIMSVDHGPQAPSIAISRMASTCGISINNIMASAVNVLGDYHGGAGEQCAQLFYDIKQRMDRGNDLTHSVEKALIDYRKEYGKTIAGFGHRFHKPIDPRAPRTLTIVRDYAQKGLISSVFADIAEEIEKQINTNPKKNLISLNVDGASAIIFCQLGVPAPLCRGLFCLARSVGILAHSWEQMADGIKNKGPIPKKYLPTYTGKSYEK